MKIRYLLLHAYGTGGTIRTVFNQAGSMAAAGHDVEIVSVLRRGTTPRFPLDPRVTITTLVDDRKNGDRERTPEPGGPSRNSGTRRPGTRRSERLASRAARYVPHGEFGIRYFDRYVEREVIRYLKGLRDGILVPTRPGLNILTARFAPEGVTLVAQEHMNLSVHRSDVRAAIARYYRRFHAIAVLTRSDQEDYERLLPGARIVRIPNAVHTEARQHTTYASHVAAAAGRLFAQKGFDLLIPAFGKAAEAYPDWELRIFGTGEKQEELRALINEHHLYNHVFLMGHSTTLDAELSKASFYVLSSRFEGLPMVMIEAMSLALPVVAYDCPTGPAEVITDGKEGLLVPPEDIEALAEAMGQLMNDEGLRADMGAAALQTARAYAPEAVHPRWERLFTELCAPASASAPATAAGRGARG
ncbi:glycosyltransferase family 4 protein [Streptomyces daliensis]